MLEQTPILEEEVSKIKITETRLRQIFDQLADPNSAYFQEKIAYIANHGRELFVHRPDLSPEDILQESLESVWKTLEKKLKNRVLEIENKTVKNKTTDSSSLPEDENILKSYLGTAIKRMINTFDRTEKIRREKGMTVNTNWPSFDEYDLGVYVEETNYGRGGVSEPHNNGNDRGSVDIVRASPEDRLAIMRRWSLEANEVIFDLTPQEVERLSSALLIPNDIKNIDQFDKNLLVLARDLEKLSGGELNKNVIAFMHQINKKPLMQSLDFFGLEDDTKGRSNLYTMRSRGKDFIQKYWRELYPLSPTL